MSERQGRIINNQKNNDILPHRLNVTANDTVNPSEGSGMDLSDFRYALVDVVLTGTDNPSWKMTPLFFNKETNQYHDGEPISVTSSGRYKIEVTGSDDFYILLTEKSGTNPEISLYVTAYTG